MVSRYILLRLSSDYCGYNQPLFHSTSTRPQNTCHVSPVYWYIEESEDGKQRDGSSPADRVSSRG